MGAMPELLSMNQVSRCHVLLVAWLDSSPPSSPYQIPIATVQISSDSMSGKVVWYLALGLADPDVVLVDSLVEKTLDIVLVVVAVEDIAVLGNVQDVLGSLAAGRAGVLVLAVAHPHRSVVRAGNPSAVAGTGVAGGVTELLEILHLLLELVPTSGLEPVGWIAV